MSRYHIPGVAVGVLYNGRADSDPLKQGVCRCIAECIRADLRKQKDRPAAVFRKFHHALIKRPRDELGVFSSSWEGPC